MTSVVFEELRYSLRGLMRRKRFTTFALLSLAIAVSVNTTMYSLLDAMIRPRTDIIDPEAVHSLTYRSRLDDSGLRQAAHMLVMRSHLFEAVAGMRPHWEGGFFNEIERNANSRLVEVVDVTSNFFSMLGVKPLAGRLPDSTDATGVASPVMLREDVWQSLFAERTVFDTATIRLNGIPRNVIGILPAHSTFPRDPTGVWVLVSQDSVAALPGHIVRLRRGVSPRHARASLKQSEEVLAQLSGQSQIDGSFLLRSAIYGQFRVADFHIALGGAVLAVLLIACVNIANVQLVRGLLRRRELATRAALGATRRALVRLLFLEACWLAIGGVILGALVTSWGIDILRSRIPPAVAEYIIQPQISWRVFLATIVLSLLCLLLIGVLPAIRASRLDVASGLRSGSDGATFSSGKYFRALVAIELALALSLVSSAAVLIRTASRLHAVDVGYDTRPLVLGTVHSATSPGVVWSPAKLALVAERAKLAEGVVNAAAWQTVTATGGALVIDVGVEGRRQHGASEFTFQTVTPGFLRTLQIPVASGRDFVTATGEWQAIIDKHMATHCWGTSNPIGRMVKLGASHTAAPEARVVGIASSFQLATSVQRLFDEPMAACPAGQLLVVPPASDSTRLVSSTFAQFAARTVNHEGRSLLSMHRIFEEDERYFHLLKVTSYDEATGLASHRASQHFVAALFALFSLIAVALACIGVFAVVAESVSQRRHEFGVRLALGATPSEVRFLAVQRIRIVILVAVAAGLLLTNWSASLLQAFLVMPDDRYDPITLGLAVIFLVFVSAIAAYAPAHTAARLDPLETLRHD